MIDKIKKWLNDDKPQEEEEEIDEDKLLQEISDKIEANLPEPSIVAECRKARRKWRDVQK